MTDASSGGPLQPVPDSVQHAADFTTVADIYRNPFRACAHLRPARTDQGVDFGADAGSSVYAVGRFRLTRSTTKSGWPGGGCVQYILLSGALKGTEHYLSEHVTPNPLLKIGHEYDGETIIAHFYGTYGKNGNWGCETGYIRPGTNEPCSTDISGRPTPGGICYTRLLNMLGCPTQQHFGPGPHGCPCGKHPL